MQQTELEREKQPSVSKKVADILANDWPLPGCGWCVLSFNT